MRLERASAFWEIELIRTSDSGLSERTNLKKALRTEVCEVERNYFSI